MKTGAQGYRPVQPECSRFSVMTLARRYSLYGNDIIFVRGGLQHPQQTRRRNQSRQRTRVVIVQTGDADAVVDPHIR